MDYRFSDPLSTSFGGPATSYVTQDFSVCSRKPWAVPDKWVRGW